MSNNPPKRAEVQTGPTDANRINQVANWGEIRKHASNGFSARLSECLEIERSDDVTGFSFVMGAGEGGSYTEAGHPNSITPQQLRAGLERLAPPKFTQILSSQTGWEGHALIYTGRVNYPKYNPDGTIRQFTAEDLGEMGFADPKTYPEGCHVFENKEAKPEEAIFPAADMSFFYLHEAPDSLIERMGREEVLAYMLTSLGHELLHRIDGLDSEILKSHGVDLDALVEIAAKTANQAPTPYSTIHANNILNDKASPEQKRYAAIECIAEMVTLIMVSLEDEEKCKGVQNINPQLYSAVYEAFFAAKDPFEKAINLGTVATT